MRRRVTRAVLAGLLLGLPACTGAASDPAAGARESPPAGGEAGLTGTLTVFAAASLTDVFTELGARLEQGNPQLTVRFSFAGSSALATQLLQGAPVDVFAPADEVQMARAEDAGLVTDPEVFAANPLVLAVPLDDPADVDPPEPSGGVPGLAELIREDLTLAVCAPEVPCGAAAAEVLESAGLSDVPDTYEDDVRAVLTKVQLGEVDAGLVYLSDVHAAADTVLAFAFSEAGRAVNRYPVAVVEDAPNPDAARAFADLVLSGDGRRLLADAGFLEP